MNLSPDEPHLPDTSAVIPMMRLGARVAPKAVLPFVTVAELLTGAGGVREPLRERAKIYFTLGPAPIIYPDQETLAIYGRISAQLQQAGRPIPTNDIWIAALALQHDTPVLSGDAHFQRVPGLKFLSAW